MESLLSLLPVLLLILLVLFFARWVSKKSGPEVPGPNGETPYGVRGALAFFVYASLTVAPILNISRLSVSLMDIEVQYPALQGLESWGQYKIATWIGTIGVVAWQMWVAVQLRNKFVPRSLTQVRVFLVLAPLSVMLLDMVACKVLLDTSPDAESLGGLLSALIFSGAWLLYFFLSKRVANTYALPYSVPDSPKVASTPVPDAV